SLLAQLAIQLQGVNFDIPNIYTQKDRKRLPLGIKNDTPYRSLLLLFLNAIGFFFFLLKASPCYGFTLSEGFAGRFDYRLDRFPLWLVTILLIISFTLVTSMDALHLTLSLLPFHEDPSYREQKKSID
ncbi:hypothetical protein ACJX0J_025435, partial [Zea mays]